MKHLLLSMITILLLSATQASANYLVRISGENQTAQAGEKFEEPIKIRVQKSSTDETPVPNIEVRFVLQKGVWINYETNPVIATLDLTTDENGEAGVVLTAGNIDEDVYRVRYAIRVTIIGDTRSVFFQLAVMGFNTQEPPTNFEQPPSDQEPPPTDDQEPPPTDDQEPPPMDDQEPPPMDDQEPPPMDDQEPPPMDDPKPDPPVDDPKPDPPMDDPKPDPPVDDPKPDPPMDDPNPDPPVVNNPDPPGVNNPDPPGVNNPNPPRNPPPADNSNPNQLPVFERPQTLDPNEIWHVMYRNDDGRATVFVYPRCVNNPHHNPPKPPCENNYGVTEEVLSQVAPNFDIELQGNLYDVNNMLDLKLAEDSASLAQVGGVQGVVN